MLSIPESDQQHHAIFKLVKRTERVAMYTSGGDEFQVIRTAPNERLPERGDWGSLYWGKLDWGKSAWSCTGRDTAEKRFVYADLPDESSAKIATIGFVAGVHPPSTHPDDPARCLTPSTPSMRPGAF